MLCYVICAQDDGIRIRPPDQVIVYCWYCVLIVGKSGCSYKICKPKEYYQIYTAFTHAGIYMQNITAVQE